MKGCSFSLQASSDDDFGWAALIEGPAGRLTEPLLKSS